MITDFSWLKSNYLLNVFKLSFKLKTDQYLITLMQALYSIFYKIMFKIEIMKVAFLILKYI